MCAFRFGALFAGEPRILALAAAGAERSLDRLGAVLAFAAGNVVSAPVSLALGLAVGGPVPGWGAGLFMCAGGGLLAAGAILWQTANARSGRPAVNALACFTPLLALGLLAAFGRAGEVVWGWLAGGALVIVAGNPALQGRGRTSSNREESAVAPR